ncbi:MAG: hypothetical protein IJW62_09605 [Clostridia bacterium]|nr:hypothetical protein [Clostridia bacterium]
MKKTFCMVLVFISLLGAGCSKADNSIQASAPETSTEYRIYFAGSYLSELQADAESSLNISNSVHALPENCDFSFSYTTAPDDLDVPLQKSFAIDGKTHQLTYTCTSVASFANSNNEALRHYGTVNAYKEEKYVFEFFQESGELSFYGNYEADRTVAGDFTKEEVMIASEAILAELFGNDCIEYYTVSPNVSELVDDRYNVFIVTYTKYIEGYPTNDQIQLRYNKQGELLSVNAKTYGLMKSVIDRYGVTQLQSAEKFLTDYIDTIPYHDKDSVNLLINSDGKCYLEIYASCKVGDNYRANSFYVNLD